MTNTVVGTPPYMAPEQEQGLVCKESDVYALAICFYEVLTGRMPFGGVGAGMLRNKMNKTFDPVSRSAQAPSAVDEVLARALEPDPARRLKTPREFIEALEAAALLR
jgi:serine/threonine-protein kinase